jgi:hypothetical protein
MTLRIGALIATVGAVGLALSMFMPWYVTPAAPEFEAHRLTFSGLQAFDYNEHLIFFGLAALVVVLSVVSLFRSDVPKLIPALSIVAGLIAAGIATFRIVVPSYHVVVRGSAPVEAGAYVALAASVVMIGGALLDALVGATPRYKRCPDCASRLRVEARVCLRCGWRGEGASQRVG